MEIMTSWEQRKSEKIAVNLLQRAMPVEEIAQVTELTLERVQQLQAQLQSENSRDTATL